MSDREFDVVIYGASGFTGRLVAEYLQAEYGGTNLKWAMAGRNVEKLSAVRDEMGVSKDIALIAANSDDPASLAEMAARTKAMITTVGPYQLYGEPLLKACAEGGTDYVDLCGEPAWMKDMIDRYDDVAKKSGARIVLSCGFDSIPFDLGVLFHQNHSIAKHGGACENIRCRVRGMKGTFSGGTAASFMETMKRAQKQPEILDWLKDPFSLSPESGAPQPPIHKPMEEADLGSWATPFIMASINTKNVHRSNALLDYRYGRDFKYGEMVLTGPGEKGEQLARGMAKSNAFGDNPPKPGEGPSKEERENGSYDVMFVGDAPDGTRIISSVKGDKDPGYGSTSKMIAEAALALVQDVKGSGGVMTSAPAMGEALLGRLQSHAGLTFAIEQGA
ncbi:saccharopine dehydrogenase [Litorimonas cladophorae]|uniref:Saccharopine dehydrogenase n=1 Tax=Litorimonas cladophorae TaxID=1220491 RepID=A0A918KM01_9PROT|nr:saccharopine dehydrogenase NADP-binding domain-containing protein [Litorimonas cladophorae]GGX68067.1 saccharopine dehydrogenase [Litorimonas cladophorae]